MAYFLAVNTNENEYNGLNIKKSGFFRNGFKKESSLEYSLEEIDNYTTKFLDEERIKACLVSEKILKQQYKGNSLAIIYAPEPGKESIIDGILYKESRDFLQNPLLAIKYIENLIIEYGREDLKEMIQNIPEDLSLLDYRKLREIVLFIYRYENAPTENRGISRKLKK